MYQNIIDDDPYQVPMMIYPASHYTMGGLWVDYNLMTTVPGLFALGEVNFSDHGANRLGASALMQGLADGYFVIPYTIGGYLAAGGLPDLKDDHDEFKEAEASADKRIKHLLSIKGSRTPDSFHRELGRIMWEYCGMSRNDEGLKKAGTLVKALREEFYQNLLVTGTDTDYNLNLQKAFRVADFLDFGELLAIDGLARRESCGCHFNEAYQTEEGEAKRDDENCSYVAAWEYTGSGGEPVLHKEHLVFENVEPTQRSYK
jgi:succinate dehydrogenase / fumarate reductase flavoprotein subunit